MDVAALRRQFPVTERMVFLNNAAESPLSLPVRHRLDAYLDQAACAPDKRPPARHTVRPLQAIRAGARGEPEAILRHAQLPKAGGGEEPARREP